MTTPKRMPKLSANRLLQLIFQWSAFLLPVLLVLFGGLGYFQEAVLASITSTPHPELVYGILLVFFAGVALVGGALWRYTRETNLALIWTEAAGPQRDWLLEERAASSYLQPLLQLFHAERPLPAPVQQAMVDQELAAIGARLDDRLSMPQYLAGALVGLGLVGTFIGLLGTLEDLGKLFATLASTENSASANPADLFADMVRRLQDPMRGMGTAFVASLYGLLGSLVLGLQILLVGKVGHGLVNLTLELTRKEAEREAQQGFGSGAVVDAEVEASHVAGQHDQFMKLVLATLSEQARLWRELGSDLHEQHTRGIQENQALRREVLSVVQTSQALVRAVQESTAADERYRAAVPRTTYWQDAWVKVQAYLQRSNTDQVLAELVQTQRAQAHTLEQVAKLLMHLAN